MRNSIPLVRRIAFIAAIILLTPPVIVAGTVVLALAPAAIAVTIRSLVVEPFRAVSNSMVPTLQAGDHLFASKFAYGYNRFSLPFDTGPEQRIFDDKPRRGDVVIVRFPPNPEIVYIKRVIGLPGDRIQMKQGLLHINGTVTQRERTGTVPMPGNPNEILVEYQEILPDGRTHLIAEKSDGEAADNTAEFLVPAGHYFMIGDNRDHSADSRYDVGFVPEEYIYARATIVFYNGGDYSRLGWVE